MKLGRRGPCGDAQEAAELPSTVRRWRRPAHRNHLGVSANALVTSANILRGLFVGWFLPIVTDFSDFLGRLHPRRTRLQKAPNALGVEESSSPRRVLHF